MGPFFEKQFPWRKPAWPWVPFSSEVSWLALATFMLFLGLMELGDQG